MPQSRREQICLESTAYYHCISRCVRRAFLCGHDDYSGKNYDHRKQWIVQRLRSLGSVFSIDIAAFAVLSNHLHLVLRVDDQRARKWSEKEVAKRWTTLFRGHDIVDDYLSGKELSYPEVKLAKNVIQVWRDRLYDLSWFMRCLNESIAREANREDGCTGRFWEGRFKCQALLDEAAIIACMAYVDLNPIRAGLSKTLEESDFTSIQQRLRDIANEKHRKKQRTNNASRPKYRSSSSTHTDLPLLRFNEGRDEQDGIPFKRLDYLELVDWTGRAICSDEKGAIPSHVRPILERLGINADNWTDNVSHLGRRFAHVIGSPEELDTYLQNQSIGWVRGITACKGLYASAA